VDTLTKYLAVAAGGAVGAMLRYYLTLSGLGRTAQPFPMATFVIIEKYSSLFIRLELPGRP
jgi:fluoride ion exporter CrcB/FEX